MPCFDSKLLIEKSPIMFSDVDIKAAHARYLELRRKMLKDLPNLRSWLKIAAECINLNGQMRILDVGCGFGFQLMELSRFSGDCIGVEITKEEARVAKKVAGGFGLNLEIVVADACSIPFKDECFAAVLSNEFFSHVKDFCQALTEQIRALKSSGRLLIWDGNILRPGTIFDLLIRYPFRTKGKYGGLKWLVSRDKCLKNIYGLDYEGKDENIKSLQLWRKVVTNETNLKPIAITTSYAYQHPGLATKLFEQFLGQILVLAEKIPSKDDYARKHS